MKIRWILATVVLASLAVSPAQAEDRPSDFLHALQEKGYGDVAVEYLNQMKESGAMPAEVADVFDLEMAKSLRAAVKGAYDEKEAARLTAEAQTHLDKFFKEKADHPAAMSAMVSWGSFSMDQAQRLLQEAEMAPEADKEKKYSESRNAFQEAQTRFTQAVEKLAARIAATPPAKPTLKPKQKLGPDLHEQLVAEWLDARMHSAEADYFIGKTYTDVNNQSRKDGLRRAEKTFDNIFQHNRESATGVNLAGLYAHMWDGRCWQDLGELDKAKDIYDEVLGDMPDPNAVDTNAAKFKDQLAEIADMVPFLTQVAYYRLMLEKKNRVEFITQARGWLNTYGNITLESVGKKGKTIPGRGQAITVFKTTDGYQGVLLELVKMELSVAAEASTKKKLQDELKVDALKWLQEGSRVPSFYQREIVVLLRKQQGKGAEVSVTDVAEARSFDEAKVIGEEAARTHNWEAAKKAYERALELADNPVDAPRKPGTKPVKAVKPDPKVVAAVREQLGEVKLMLADLLYGKGNYAECFEATKPLVRDYKESVLGPRAGSLAVSASLAMYTSAATPEAQAAALAQLEKVAAFVKNTWSSKPEADDARICLGQALIVQGKIPEAIKVFDEVDPRSDRYPTAVFMKGRAGWTLYLGIRKGDKAKAAEIRAQALKDVEGGFAAIQKADDKKGGNKQVKGCQLLLAQIYLEGKEPKKAVPLIEPLANDAIKEKADNLDAETLKIFAAALQAYTETKDFDKAGGVAKFLVESPSNTDNPILNSLLIEYGKMLEEEVKKAKEAADDPSIKTKTIDEANQIKDRYKTLADGMQVILKKLVVQQRIGLNGLLWISTACSAQGLTKEADDVRQRIAKDPSSKNKPNLVNVLIMQAIKDLEAAGNYEQAITEVEKLIKANPKSLDPLMTKARLYQEWAEKDPKQFQKAVDEWVGIRNLLGGLASAKRPKEYYEITYNAALCLHRQALKTKDKDAAAKANSEARKLLRATLVTSGTLGKNPDLVPKFNDLIKEIEAGKK